MSLHVSLHVFPSEYRLLPRPETSMGLAYLSFTKVRMRCSDLWVVAGSAGQAVHATRPSVASLILLARRSNRGSYPAAMPRMRALNASRLSRMAVLERAALAAGRVLARTPRSTAESSSCRAAAAGSPVIAAFSVSRSSWAWSRCLTAHRS